jgi:hypothetical protein
VAGKLKSYHGHYKILNGCKHENPHSRKKVSTAQNWCSSPDAIMLNPNKINRQSYHQSGYVRSGYMKISMWRLIKYLEISH